MKLSDYEYFRTDNGVLYKGNVTEVLSGMEAESVHCCVTSPPYWGLRDYGIPPVVWDDPGDCRHAWGDKQTGTQRIRNGVEGGLHEGRETNKLEGNIILNPSQGQFCTLCGAWLGCFGLEPPPGLYVQHSVQIFREVRRILHPSGCLFLNLGSSYASSNTPGYKPKDLIDIPHLVVEALRQDGWYYRSDMPWLKRSAMPSSVTDRPASALEYVFLLTKSAKYFWDMDAVRVEHKEPWRSTGKIEKGGLVGNQSGMKNIFHNREYNPSGRNFRNTDLFFQSLKEPHGMIFAGDEPVGLDVNPQAFPGSHFATFPEKLIEPLILAGTSARGCCPCGEPWRRVTKDQGYSKHRPSAGKDPRSRNEDKQALGSIGGHHGWKGNNLLKNPPKTIGWEPGCNHGHDPVPCTVLDCFNGAGTSYLVSAKHNRRYKGIEISQDYADMTKARLELELSQPRLPGF